MLMSLEYCPLCGSSQRKRLLDTVELTVYECKSCTLRYLSPCFSPQAMKAAYESNESLVRLRGCHDGYYDYGNLSIKSKTLSDFERALELLEGCLPETSKPRSIFDVGFGNGLFLAAAKRRNWMVNGIDASLRNVELAHQKFSLKLSCASLEQIGDFNQQYDVISFWDVIEHLQDPNLILKKTWHLLNPNGYLLIGLPNDKSLVSLLALFLYQITLGQFKTGVKKIYFLEHVAYYNLKTLKMLLHRNNFSLRRHFFTSTDLAKYSLPPAEKAIASGILRLGKLVNLENRLVAIFQKSTV